MIPMSRLLATKAVASEARFPVTEVFFEEATGRLIYVALKTGGAFAHEEVVVAVSRFAAPPEAGADWPVEMDAEAVAEAPVWSGGETGRPGLAIETWPPLIVGPFGGTESPLMLYGALAAQQETQDGVEPDRADADGRVFRLERATQRIGGEVFGRDGYLGLLRDFGVASEDLAIRSFVVEADCGARTLPYDVLRHMADDARHVVLDLSRDQLKSAARDARLV